VQVNLRKCLFEFGEERLIVRDSELGMDSPLEEDPSAATGHRFRDLRRNFIKRQNVGVRVPGGAIESTEAAAIDADVGVVDVAINDKGDVVWGCFSPTDCIRSLAQLEELSAIEEGLDLLAIEPLACDCIVEETVNICHTCCHLSMLSKKCNNVMRALCSESAIRTANR
jgi:hypothetical protein